MPPTLSKKNFQSKRKANAAGFAKRHARKAAVQTADDVYEYSSEKNRRSAIKLSLDKEEEMGVEADFDADEVDYSALRARIMDLGDKADVINSEDDEEIDSDNAFEESDEDRFAGFSFAKPSKKKPQNAKAKAKSKSAVRFAEVDLDEEVQPGVHSDGSSQEGEDEEEEGDSDEFLDVLDVLDGRGELDLGDDSEEADGDGDEDEEGEEGEEVTKPRRNVGIQDPFAPSDDEPMSDEEALDNLDAFVSKLEYGTKRKAEEATDKAEDEALNVPRKRRMIQERTEAGAEGEFGVHAAAGSKLQLDDLLAPLASNPSLLALKKSTKPLTKGDALPAPLPLRTQERLDREAAYEQTKEEADHLSFPLQVPQKINASNAGLASKFKPSTELESAVDTLLKAAQMRDETEITKTEELKMNHLSVEEVAQRRAELRKTRELLFRAEAKAKRIAKIKSKTYRKIQRKTREKIGNLIKEAEGGGDEDDEEERMKHEVERARERATLRHKNTGKWARAMKGRGELEVDQRKEIEEMLEKGERLRAKIQGDGESDSDDEDEDDDVADIKAKAFEEVRRIEEGAHDDNSLPIKKKGVFGMKFMQEAMARDAHDFRGEMARIGGSEDGVVEGGDLVDGLDDVQIQRTGGRMTFRPGQLMNVARPLAPSDSSSTLKSSDHAVLSPAVDSFTSLRSPPLSQEDVPPLSPPSVSRALPEVNPWLQPGKTVITQSRRKNEIVIGKDSSGAAKTKNQTQKQLKKHVDEREKARDDATVEISMDDVLEIPDEPTTQANELVGGISSKVKTKQKAHQNGLKVDAAFEDSDADSEIEAQEQHVKANDKGKGTKAFQQRDLVAMAFAGDNVVQDFEKLKKREVEEDAPREEDHTLPGWGSWGGPGAKKNPKAKKFIKKVAGIDPKTRADYGKPHLIISERKDKKASKYLVKDLPYPYTSKAQFEKAMDIPIGTEWNTRVSFQRQTLPRVVKKLGTVIDPLEKLF
ncbi:Utp14-domain-containing protein [Hysterangium stoloniferum]|nr:Utp14-domain-containing protein [Hysterangium stoloniferum]